MKVLNASQIRELDSFSITHEPIKSIDLMERAANSCVDWILEHFSSSGAATIVCGSGNNGGDGLAIARLLGAHGWRIDVIYPHFGKTTEDFGINLDRLQETAGISHLELTESDPFPHVPPHALIVDAMFGTGLTRPLEGAFEKWAGSINSLPNIVVSIDIPSGVFADSPTLGAPVQADFTLSFEVPKRAFMIPENQQYVGEWVVLPIGLHQDRLLQLDTSWFVSSEDEISQMLKQRRKYDHKGVFGHALIIAGSAGKAGAAILASQAALRSGVGLVTAHVPAALSVILQAAIPEVMVNIDTHQYQFTKLTTPQEYSAIGIGCGLGTDDETVKGLRLILEKGKSPLVLDADALNAIGLHPEMLPSIPENAILTPHIKEFERMFGPSDNHFDRLEKLRTSAMTHRIYIVLKGAHSVVATPEGNLYFNTTGNPGMATAGSGDVLTGIITGLLAQRYTPQVAAQLGVWIHGLAGDFAADELGYEALIASDIIRHLATAFQHLHGAD